MTDFNLMSPREIAPNSIHLEALNSGVNPKTIVTALVWDGKVIREESREFATLEEALSYARALRELAG